jgi:hypothetical protein
MVIGLQVRDEEGRRRFHGAFTGGFSAGYYNTVGTKEGWTPQTFTSSRKNRAEMKKQSIYSFLDEEDIKVHNFFFTAHYFRERCSFFFPFCNLQQWDFLLSFKSITYILYQ